METDFIEFLKAIAITGVAVIGWLIRNAVQNLNSSIKKLDATMNDHHIRITKLEWEKEYEKHN